MKRFVFSLIFLPAFYSLYAQNNEFELKVTLKPFKNKFIYLGYYYGKQKPIVDSVLLNNNSNGIFKRARKMEKGIYLVGYPGKTGYFEILIDKEQKFSVIADTVNLLNTIKFIGSPDNILFTGYQKFSADKGREIEANKTKLSFAKNNADSAKWEAAIKKIGNDIQVYRTNLIKQHPTSTITALLKAMREPEIPVVEKKPGVKYDSLFAYRYFKDHFWDDTYFYDERLARTTFFEPKVDQYFEQLVYPDPDSVIKELDWMLAYASANDEMQKFLLIKFVNRYITPKYMWDDRVFVYLFEKYFSEKSYPWLNEKGKKNIFDRAYSMMANQFGTQAADIALPDSTGKMQTLFSLSEPYTVVLFWDPTCSHCKEMLPKIDSIYRAKWKANKVEIFAIAKETDGNRKDWLDFVNGHHLDNWVHVYNSKSDNEARMNNNIPSYYQLYDVQTVPTLYLLDKDKHILAKKIPFEQIDEVLQYKLKGQ